jgi:hypothetical protein
VVRVGKLEVRVSAERLARWQEAAASSGSLSAWVRAVCDRAAAPRPVEESARSGTRVQRPPAEPSERNAMAAAERAERDAPRRRERSMRELIAEGLAVPEINQYDAPGQWGQPARRVVDEAQQARSWLERQEGRAVEEPPAGPPPEPPAPKLDPMRPGRCRQHPAARPNLVTPDRCSWGCRLPPD